MFSGLQFVYSKMKIKTLNEGGQLRDFENYKIIRGCKMKFVGCIK